MSGARGSLAERLARQRGRVAGDRGPAVAPMPPVEASAGSPPAENRTVPAADPPPAFAEPPAPAAGLPASSLPASGLPVSGPPGESREEKLARLRTALRRTEAGWKAPRSPRPAPETAPDADDDSPRPSDETRPNPRLDHRSLRRRMSRIRSARALRPAEAPPAAPPSGPGHERSDHDFPTDAAYGGHPLSRLATLPRSLSARLEATADAEGVALDRAFFLDTETSGLAGGTGTFAFLIGIGALAGDRFRVTQFLLRSPAAEREMLEEFLAEIGDRPEFVTYNGKSFDLPLLEARLALNGLPSPFADAPHLDLLTPARRLFLPRHESAKLFHLENRVLGVERHDDIPGAQIPAIFFEFLRNGEHPAMESVLEHNRYDLRSLAALTVESALRLAEDWDTEHGADLHGVGAHLLKREEHEAANRLFERALAAGLSGRNRDRCLLHLGEERKRRGDWPAAVALWQRIEKADTPEYLEALRWFAKYEEHENHDYARALAHVHDAQDRLDRVPARFDETLSRRREDWAHRAARLEGKSAD